MNDYDIDSHDFARHVREAQEMRSEAIAALFRSAKDSISRLAGRIAALWGAGRQRRSWNQAVPTPHR